MHEAVLMLYGEYQNEEGIVHPWEEDMFREPHKLQQQFLEQGVEFHVGRALEMPSGRRALGDLPLVAVAQNPIYDQNGVLQRETVFKRGSLANYPAIIDHWVANFQDRAKQLDGSMQRTAYGLGVSNHRLWNCRPIQDMGNNKGLMDMVLQSHEVGLATYATVDLGRLADEYPGKKIIYKPIDGSRGKGIEVFDDAADVQRAMTAGNIAKSGLLQPYLDLRSPIQGLVPANQEAADKLRVVNATDDRVREIRMHVLAYTDDFGSVQAEAYPTLKYSHPGTPTMQVAGNVALDPESVSADMRKTSVKLARSVVDTAEVCSGEEVSQYYGVFDWMIDSEGRTFVGDANCRGPALAPEALAAREAFTRILAASALRQC